MQITQRKTSELVPYSRNARTHSEKQIEKIAKSIQEFGFTNPILTDGKNGIIAGHGRLLAAKQLGMEDVPTIDLAHLNDTQKRAYVIADNKLALDAGWDMELLGVELQELQLEGFDVALTGFDDFKFDEAEEKKETNTEEDDYKTEIEMRVNPGDVWKLGPHRLMCGDSTNVCDVDRLCGDMLVDLVFCDPPYGMKKENEGVTNDNLNYDDLLEFNRQWIPLAFSKMKENGSFYCWGQDEPLMDIYANIIKPMIKTNKVVFRNLLTWDKGYGQGMSSDAHRMYATSDEKCLFVMNGTQGFNNNADNYYEGFEPIRKYLEESRIACGWSVEDMKRAVGHSDLKKDHWTSKSQWNMPTREVYSAMHAAAKQQQSDAFKKEYDEIKKEYDEIKKNYDEIKKEFYSTRAYFNNTHDNMRNVWQFDRARLDEATGGHATPKPISLCVRAVKTSCPDGGIVLDLFGGSGSTLIACERTSRSCYMMELEPKWCSVILSRWEKETGKTAVIQNSQNEHTSDKL